MTDQASEASASCAVLAPWPWPSTTVERRLHLRRLESAQDQCITHAGFLAVLGALWLEEGEAEKARVWLERSLLLEPENLGAQADHALALAALGEPAALKELAASWRLRIDVPAALRRRVEGAGGLDRAITLAPARLGGGMDWPRYSSRGEASILLGYDTNLSVSPRYSDLRIGDENTGPSPPERRGGALRAEVLWLGAWELNPRRVLRTGFSLAARSAPGEAKTNWQQAQTNASLTQRWNGWSASAQADLTWFGGSLTEPYTLGRARLVLERLGENCSQAAQIEADGRRQRDTRSYDSTAVLLGWRLQCQPARNLQASVSLRGGTDRSNQGVRPGGTQRSLGGVLRLEYRPDPLNVIDFSLGSLRVDDSEIYSVFLEGHPVRRQVQTFASLEFSRAVSMPWLTGAEWVVQLGRYRQSSNIVLFQHRGTTAYTGLRWPW